MRNPYKIPRSAYCTGCGVTFRQHHELINHRRSFRCGGRFLPLKERIFLNNLRALREAQERRDRLLATTLAG